MQGMLCQRTGDRLVAERGHGGHAVQRTFQLADVFGKAFCDEIEHIVGNVGAVHGGHHAQDGDSGLQIRRLDVDGQAGFKAGDQACLEPLEVFWRYVGGDHNALIGLMQRVERMEELFECSFLAAQELDVVDQQYVDLAVTAVEFLDLAGILVGIAQRFDEFVGEFLAGYVANLQIRILDQGVIADGVQQVRLAQTGAAIDT